MHECLLVPFVLIIAQKTSRHLQASSYVMIRQILRCADTTDQLIMTDATVLTLLISQKNASRLHRVMCNIEDHPSLRGIPRVYPHHMNCKPSEKKTTHAYGAKPASDVHTEC